MVWMPVSATFVTVFPWISTLSHVLSGSPGADWRAWMLIPPVRLSLPKTSCTTLLTIEMSLNAPPPLPDPTIRMPLRRIDVAN